MKRLKINIIFLRFALFVLCMNLFLRIEIFAAGTPAGTIISSRTIATFTTQSGAIDSAFSNIVSITVSQKAAVNISPLTNTIVTVSDSTNADYSATITNSGNGNDLFLFSSTSSRNWTVEYYFDANGDGILQPTEITAGQIFQTASISADASYKIIVRIKVPRGEPLNGLKDTTVFKVTSQFNNGVTNQASYVTTVQTSNISAVANVDNSSPNAGQQITYTLVVTNNGAVTASAITISDLLDTKLQYISSTTSQGTITSSTNPVIWNIGTLNPGNSVTITVTAQVKNGTFPNSVINNSFALSYSVGNNTYSIGSNNVAITVGSGSAYGVNIIPMWNSLTKEANDTVIYRFRITNTGILKDVIELNLASSQNFNWQVFKDANNNGILDATDPVVTNTNSVGGIDTDTLSANDSVKVFARTVLPRKSDGTRDSLHLTGVSTGNQTISTSATVVTTIHAENIVSSLTIFPTGNQPAGEEVTYTIAYQNTGNSAVENFAVSNEVPTHTEYVVNSVKVNGIPIQDNTGIVSISKNLQNKTVITVSVGKINSKAGGSVEFSVKIK